MTLGWSVPARLVRWMVATVVNAAVLYALTGRRDLPWVWASLVLGSAVTLVLFLTIDRELVRERWRPGPGAVDRLSQWLAVALFGIQWIIACVDVGRFHWSDSVPPAVHVLGLALNAAGFGLIT